MIDSLPAVLGSLASSGAALNLFRKWHAETKGNVAAIIDELKDNLRFCLLVLEEGVAIDKAAGTISTAEFTRLRKGGFNFNKLQGRRIPAYKSLENTDLASWRGKTTEELVINIYDKLKDLQALYPHSDEDKKRRLQVRVANIHKRILLLLKHAAS